MVATLNFEFKFSHMVSVSGKRWFFWTCQKIELKTIRTSIVALTFSSSFQRPGCVNETANQLRAGRHGGPASRFAALAEFERSLIREWHPCWACRSTCQRPLRRSQAQTGGQVREIKVLLRAPEILVADVARRYGMSRTTLYKHVGVVAPRHP